MVGSGRFAIRTTRAAVFGVRVLVLASCEIVRHCCKGGVHAICQGVVAVLVACQAARDFASRGDAADSSGESRHGQGTAVDAAVAAVLRGVNVGLAADDEFIEVTILPPRRARGNRAYASSAICGENAGERSRAGSAARITMLRI